MKFKVGDRVRVKMGDRYGKLLYGTVIDPAFLRTGVLVKTDTLVSKQYCLTDDDEVLFMREHLEKLDE